MRTWKWLYIALVIGVLLSMISAIWVGAAHTNIQLQALANPVMFVCVALYIGYCLANAAGWAWILRALRHPIPVVQAVPLWIRTESFRWLPGSVWNFGARSIEVTRWNVPKSIAVGSISLELAFAVVTRLILAIGGGLLVTKTSFWHWETPSLSVIGLSLVATLMIGVVGLILFQRLQSVEQWRRLRDTIEQFSLSNLCSYGIWLGLYYTGLSVLYGIAFHYLIVALMGPHDIPLSVLVVANAGAWLVGFFAVFAPGGLLVREAALATVLATWFTPVDCITIAVAWRLVQTGVELILLVAVLLLSTRWFRFVVWNPSQRTTLRHQL